MNICMFTNTFLPHVGGVARSVSAFAEDLRSRGHQVLVVAPIFPGLDDRGEDRSKVLRVPAIQNFNGTDFSVRLPLPGRIHQRLDRFRPDIIHSHHPFLLGDAALRTAKARALPLIFTHHTLYERYTHYVPFDSPAMERFAIHLSTRYANLCQMVIAPSESLAALIQRRGVETSVRVVPTGVDVAYFDQGDGSAFRRKNAIPEDAFVIGHLGRLASEKNLAYLARAAAAYLENDEQARFLIAGRGPSEAQIEKIFAERDLSGRIIRVGLLKGDDLRSCYAAMDLFVFASTSETQGMVLTEAMAAGKPVIALNASGVREVIRDGENGRLLSSDTPEQEFAAAISQCAANPGLARRWGDGAKRTARDFSRESAARRLEDTYLEARERRPGEKADELGGWDAWLRALRAEWDLLSEKTGAVFSAVRSDPTTRTDLE